MKKTLANSIQHKNSITMKRRNFIATNLFASLSLASFPVIAQTPEDKTGAITNKINKKPLKPFYISPDGPDFRGAAKIRFDEVNNQLSVWEHVVPPKSMGPPPHVHKDLDEIMRVLQGTASVLIGEEVYNVPEGGWLMRPHGIVHTYWNASDKPLKFMDIYPNQNFEVFLEKLIKLFGEFSKEGTVPDSKEAIKRLDTLQAEWGITMYYDQAKAIRDKYGVS